MNATLLTPPPLSGAGGLGYVEQMQGMRPKSLLASMLTMKQVAEMAGISYGALQQRLANGTGPKCHRLGKRVLFKASEVQSWMAVS